MPRRPVIAVIGAGHETEPSVSNARELGRLIAENGWVLITGGRDAGVMRGANQGAKEIEGSLTIGIMPNGKTKVAAYVDVLIITDMGEARNNIIVLSADVVIACGLDDPGTASEVALALKSKKPVIFVGASDAAKEFFGGIAGDQYISRSPDDAVQIAREIIGS